jgi:hypothetical protein
MNNSITNFEAVNKVIMFGFNYPHNFISAVWGANTSLSNHLQSKFSTLYDSVGSKAIFNCFYCQLSSDNQAILIDWILANYKG